MERPWWISGWIQRRKFGRIVKISKRQLLEAAEVVEVVVILRILIHLACYRCGVRGHLACDCPQAGAAPQGSGNAVPSQRKFSQSGQKGPRGRGRGRSVRFGGLNVLYDEAGNEYPVDDAGQLYVPLGYEPAVTEEVIEEENTKEIKN